MADGVAKNSGCHGGQNKKIYIYINTLKLKKQMRTEQEKKIVVSNRKKKKMGLSKVKRGCQLAKGKKKLQT